MLSEDLEEMDKLDFSQNEEKATCGRLVIGRLIKLYKTLLVSLYLNMLRYLMTSDHS